MTTLVPGQVAVVVVVVAAVTVDVDKLVAGEAEGSGGFESRSERMLPLTLRLSETYVQETCIPIL